MGLFDYLRYAAQANQAQPDYGTTWTAPAPATVQQPAPFQASNLPWQDQLAGAIDYANSSGDAWGAIGRDGVINYMGDELQQQYGTRNLSDFRYVEDPGAPGGYRLDWAGRQPATGLVSALGDSARSMGITAGSDGGPLQAMNPSDALSFGATWEGEGGTNFNFFRKPDGSVGIKTGGQTSNETGDILAAAAILAGGYMAGTGALGGAAGGAGAAEAGAAGAGTAGAAGSSTAAMGAGAADLGMAGFGQFGIPSAIPAGAGYGSLGATALSAPVSTFGGAAIGSGMAGTLAGLGAVGGAGGGGGAGAAGVTDLGGGLSMGADGAITGATGLNPSTLSNAGLMESVGYGGAGTATMGAGGSGGGAGGAEAITGTPPPANPYHPASYLNPTNLSNLATSGGASSLLGPAASVLGAISGGQGQEGSSSSTRELPPYLQGPVANDLVPRTQGLLAAQSPGATSAGAQLLAKGSGLLGQTAPSTATNPYLSSIADDMQRRTSELLGQNNLAIQGNFVGTGGLGGSRQGVAQGVAAGKAADYLQGNLAGLYGNAYNQDQNRTRQDWTIGSGLMNQGVNTPFLPAQNAAQIYSPFTGFGTTTNNTQQGGGWQGAVGGALAGASFGRNMGWW